MSLYLNTRGLAKASIAICGRCSKKYPYVALMPDPNVPGLRVCPDGCRDELDPYRLPPRQSEVITLRFPRPDVSLATNPSGLIDETDTYFLITEDGDDYLLP